MGLKISKRYSSYSVHPKRSWGHWLPWRTQAIILFLANLTSFNVVELWNCNKRVDGITLKCAISRRWLIVEQNDRSFLTHGHRKCIYRVLFMSDYLSSVWDNLVHFAKFLMLRSLEDYSSHSCHPIWTKLCDKCSNQGECRPLHFGHLQQNKRCGTL